VSGLPLAPMVPLAPIVPLVPVVPLEAVAPEQIAAAFGLWVLWALVHSVLAAPAVKARLEQALGPRATLYPLGYTLVSLITFAAAWGLEPRLPQLIWAVTGPAELILHGLQLAGLGLVGWAGLSVHAFKMFGLTQFWALLRNQAPEDRDLRQDFTSSGAYGVVRHPMHLGGMVFLACQPRLSLASLVFAVFGILYLLVGSLLEERRLAAALGPVWADYARRVPMLIPRLWPRLWPRP